MRDKPRDIFTTFIHHFKTAFYIGHIFLLAFMRNILLCGRTVQTAPSLRTQSTQIQMYLQPTEQFCPGLVLILTARK